MTPLKRMMRVTLITAWTLVLGTLLLLPSASAAFKYLQVGMEAPTIGGTDLRNGEAFDAGTLAEGEVLLVTFWATWSGRSLEQLRDLVEMSKRYEESPLQIVAINVEGLAISPTSRRLIDETVSTLEPPFPVIIDEGLEIFYQYGVIAVPSTAVVGSDGTLRYDPAGYSYTVRDRIVDSTEVLLGLRERTETAPLAQGYRPEKKASRYYRLAVQLASQRLYERAMANLESAAEIDSLFAAPHNLQGQIALELGEDEPAAEAFRRAVSLDPASVAAWAGWGRALLRAGLHEEAIEKLESSLDLDSAYTPALLDLALCHAQLDEDSGKALELLTSARELNPMDASVHFYLGRIHKSFDRKRLAIGSYRMALEILYPDP